VKTTLGTDFPEIQQWIQHQVAQILALDSIGTEGDLVTLGMDSLQIVRLAQTLDDAQHQLLPAQQHTPWTSPMLYDLATIPSLANAVYKNIHGDAPETTEISIPTWSREDTLTKFIWEQAQFLGTGGLTVALTGSTGELGSYLLNTLLQDPSIKQIICLNRSADAAERQLASFEDKRLSSAWLTETDRVKFWHSSLDEEYLGLALDKYDYLQDHIDVVIHNAWLVNFNLPVAAFKSQIIGLRRLLALVEKASHDASFHFVSSVSTVAGLSAPGLVIPETLHGMGAVLQQGYGESKFVGESICGIASQNSNSRIVIHRVGQLGGPSDSEAGIWNTRDWFPSLVRSSQTMQRLPDSLGSFQVDWVPIVCHTCSSCDHGRTIR
jgi:nucleoside-diphosphate-sugar epimerase